MRCECGCGFEGEDPVTQLLIEEALALRLDGEDAIAAAREAHASELAAAVAAAQQDAKKALERGF